MSTEDQVSTAAALAQQATELSAGLKAGSWESVQSIALASIATSLAVLARASKEKPFSD